MREADLSLTLVAAHELSEGVTGRDAELVLEVDHSLSVVLQNQLVVFSDMLEFAFLLDGAGRLSFEILQYAYDVGLDGTGGDYRGPRQIIPGRDELEGHVRRYLRGNEGLLLLLLLTCLVQCCPWFQGRYGLGEAISGGTQVVHDLQVVQPCSQTFADGRFGRSLRAARARRR